ncbi:hypothetical protein V502_00389 [Pseudogymnoascus sp. VKM F-4520 (FW-2644)]|nr:hypothetical protein V502_00389 [Pseudogymnoascus sp. VKM F-4520 (FW-2644)]
MSHLQCYCYDGFGVDKKSELWYSQAVRVGDRIERSGQGRRLYIPHIEHTRTYTFLLDTSSKIPEDLDEEVEQAFANVEHNLKHAGGKGWCQVFRVNLYLTDINEQAVIASVRNLKKWMPNHQPLLTCIGVNQLGLPGMRVEVEVSAHDEDFVKAATAAK